MSDRARAASRKVKSIAMLCAALAMVATSGCTNEPASKYHYLKDGARWEMAVETLLPNGEVRKTKVIARIDGTEEIGGKVYHKKVVVPVGIPGREPAVTFLRVESDGVYSITEGFRDVPPTMSARLPVEIGATWVTGAPDGSGQIVFTYSGIETAELPDRKYEDCLLITFEGSTSEGPISGYAYAAPGIGDVKSVLQMGQVTVESLLVAFDP